MHRLFSREAKGQSLVELVIGIGVVSIIIGSVVGALILSVRINKHSVTSKIASSLAQELLDDVRSITEGNWANLYGLAEKGPDTTYFIFSKDTLVSGDAVSASGAFSSLAIDSWNNPVIAYYSAIDNLKVIHCNDVGCIDDNESVETVDSGGFYNSMKLDSDGNPIIAHSFDPSGPGDDFKIVHCNDINCDPIDGPESSVIVDSKARGFSLQLNSFGNPVVSYQRSNGQKVYLLRCDDIDCLSFTITAVDKKGTAGDYTAMQLSQLPSSMDFPVIAYSSPNRLSVIRCDDVNCVNEPQNVVDSAASGVSFVSLELDSNEYPVVSYFDSSPRYDLKILHCNDVNCFGGDESIELVDATGGESTSLELDSFGNPVVSYIAENKLKILHCNDPNCSGGDESIIVVDDADPDANVSGTSLQLDNFGNPVVSYYDDIDDDLRVLHCDDPNCDENISTVLAIASGTVDINIDNATYTRWFSVENVNRLNGKIVDSGGIEDPSTQKVTTHVTWPFFGDTTEVSIVEYFTRWTRNRSTVFTDWGGSSGDEGPITKPDSDYSASTNIDFTTTGEMQLLGSNTAGNLISSTFNTGLPYGVQINSILWQGSFGSGGANSVKFQIASSNCSNGATDSPACITSLGWGGSKSSGDGAFIGLGGTSSTYYEPTNPNVGYAIPINQHNNKRYFRYKVFLDRDSISTSPVVEDVVLNWSP